MNRRIRQDLNLTSDSETEHNVNAHGFIDGLSESGFSEKRRIEQENLDKKDRIKETLDILSKQLEYTDLLDRAFAAVVQEFSPDEKWTFISSFIEKAPSDSISRIFDVLSKPQPPTARPADAPPLWAKRSDDWNKTGKKSSCVLWIKLHYGNKDPENWDPMGLTLKDLRHDRPLYDAFAKWIKDHPEDDFDPKVRRPLVRYTDPQEAVERLRGQKRASEARLRKG